MCIYNNLIDNAKYKPNKKNAGIIPAFSDIRVLVVPISCGNCIECRKQKAREWLVRMLEDIKHNKGAKFVTLTFGNESIIEINKQLPETYKNRKGKILPLTGYKRDNEIATWAVKHFRERWRKKFKTSPRHWLITELGHKGTENIHLHGIIYTKETFKDIREKWNYGYIYPRPNEEYKNYVSSRSINYMMKYVQKIDKQHPNYKQIVLTSPGIGRGYTEDINGQWKRNKFNGTETKETYKTPSGHEIAMPIYWRNKIYTEEEKEKLWINRIEKGERWVCGEKIDMKQEGWEEQYKQIKAWHRKRNTQLGYGTNYKDYNQIDYENKRREYMLDKRIGTLREEFPLAVVAGIGIKGERTLVQETKITRPDKHIGPERNETVKQAGKEANKVWKQINSNLNKINENKPK